MKGAIIGDIVGSIYEWDNIKFKDFPLFQQSCFFTDDTVMTVAVGEALMQASVWSSKARNTALIKSMQKWGAEYPNSGYGGSFYSWLISPTPQPYNSWGNGAPMRCSAAGWIAVSAEDAKNLGRQTAKPTHNHPEALKAAECTALLIYLARNGAAIEELRKRAELYYELPLLDEIRPSYQFSEYSQDTMPVALSAFFESTGFEDAIRNAISVGGDSDTIAAITGSIPKSLR